MIFLINIKYLILLFTNVTLANDSQLAIETTTKALIVYPNVKYMIKRAEEHTYTSLGISNKQAKIFLALVPLTTQKISTRMIRSSKSLDSNPRMRPDFEYNIRSKETKVAFSLEYSF